MQQHKQTCKKMLGLLKFFLFFFISLFSKIISLFLKKKKKKKGPDPLQFVHRIVGNLDNPTRGVGVMEATWVLALLGHVSSLWTARIKTVSNPVDLKARRNNNY
jgi:hypothetical protein